MKGFVIAITAVVLFNLVTSQEKTSRPSVTENDLTQEYLRNLDASGYNREVLPDGNGGYGSPIEVLCTMYVLDITKVDDRSMDYRAQFYFRQSWNDSRLAYLDMDINSITLNNREKIWTPDLFFVQEREGLHHNLITDNTFVKISPEGEVHYSVRLSVTFSCRMDFSKYPHDTQKCVFSVESYGFTRDKVEIQWDQRRYKDPVKADPDINVFPFELKSIKHDAMVVEFNPGARQYKALRIEFQFQRKSGFFVNRLYIPFIFLVVLSWMSFLIPAKIVSIRLSFLLVLLYLMVHIGSGINDFIPPSSYTKGSDVWIAVCESLVFAAFLEFIAVHIISRNKDKIDKKLKKNDPEAQRVLEPEAKNNGLHTITIMLPQNQSLFSSQRIDKLCLILFPVAFTVFNVIYWIAYCAGS